MPFRFWPASTKLPDFVPRYTVAASGSSEIKDSSIVRVMQRVGPICLLYLYYLLSLGEGDLRVIERFQPSKESFLQGIVLVDLTSESVDLAGAADCSPRESGYR